MRGELRNLPNCHGGKAICFPNVIVWLGLDGHELRPSAGEMAWFVRSRGVRRWLMLSRRCLVCLEAREKKIREEAERVQAVQAGCAPPATGVRQRAHGSTARAPHITHDCGSARAKPQRAHIAATNAP